MISIDESTPLGDSFLEIISEVRLVMKEVFKIEDTTYKNKKSMNELLSKHFEPEPDLEPKLEPDCVSLDKNPCLDSCKVESVPDTRYSNTIGLQDPNRVNNMEGLKNDHPKEHQKHEYDKDYQQTNPQDTETLQDVINILYKKIALKCHPDKTTDSLLNKLFVVATKSKSEMNVIELIYLVSKINITDIHFSETHIEIVRSTLHDLKQHISQMKNTVQFHWSTFTNEEKMKYISIIQARVKGS